MWFRSRQDRIDEAVSRAVDTALQRAIAAEVPALVSEAVEKFLDRLLADPLSPLNERAKLWAEAAAETMAEELRDLPRRFEEFTAHVEVLGDGIEKKRHSIQSMIGGLKRRGKWVDDDEPQPEQVAGQEDPHVRATVRDAILRRRQR